MVSNQDRRHLFLTPPALLAPGLAQGTEYLIRVKASNPAGESSWSRDPPLPVRTLVDPARLPGPDRLAYERSTGLTHIRLPPSSSSPPPQLINFLLVLEARAEAATEDGEQEEDKTMWIEVGRHVLTDNEPYIKLNLADDTAEGESSLSSSFLPLFAAGGDASGASVPMKLRGRLCLKDKPAADADGATTTADDACGPYIIADIVDVYNDDAAAVEGGAAGAAQPWLVALIVVVTLLGLVAVLVAVKCVCHHGGGGGATSAVKSAVGVGGSSNGHHHRGGKKKKRTGGGATMLGPELILDPAAAYKAQLCVIASENQHGMTAAASASGTGVGASRSSRINHHHHRHNHHHGPPLPACYDDDITDATTPGGDSSAANSQEPLWAYQQQQSPADSSASSGQELHYPAAALQGYVDLDAAYPGYPYIDETPTTEQPDQGAYFLQDTQEYARRHSRVLSGECK